MPQDISNIGGYYNRFDPTQNYERQLFRAGKVLQSAELNEMESASQYRLKSIADALFKDGDIVRDAQLIVDAESGAAQCQSGALYLSGAVRGVASAEFVIATVGIVTVGVYLQESVITELDDPALRDPATGTRNYEEPGAARLKLEPVWGFAGDGHSGDFYPVYTVEDGSVQAKDPPPQLDAVTQALARYDRDSSGGSYVVSGLNVALADDLESGEQVYTLSEGRARINGYGVELFTSRRLVYPAEANTRYIDSEPHISSGPAPQRINLDRTPAGEITQVRITSEKTVNLTHGSFTGAQDPLPDTSVLSITSVSQGGANYVAGTDYKLTAGKVDWSPGGAEVAPGSTYIVTYQYIAGVAPSDRDDKGFTVTGALAGTLVLVSYNHLLPRIDRLCLNADGQLLWMQGIAADYNPSMPTLGSELLPIAAILQTWDANRRVINDSVRTVKMEELYAVNSKLDHIIGLVAQQRLEASINLREAGAKKGLFTDPFLDDSQRDRGLEQTATVFRGELSLTINADAYPLNGDLGAPNTLSFNVLPVLEQTKKTGEMKVNPYQAFDPIYAKVTLTPAEDCWTSESSMTEVVGLISSKEEWLNGGIGETVTTYVDTVIGGRATYNAADYLRPINVQFSITGFSGGEQVQQITFDGIAVTPGNQSNSAGAVMGSFTIPDKTPVGSKLVRFIGTAGSVGEATFTGSGTLITTTYIVSRFAQITKGLCRTDPLAQTFSLNENGQIAGVDLWFRAKGASPVIVHIRETTAGVPNQIVLGEIRVSPAGIITSGAATRVLFDAPVALMAGQEYALVVLCNDAVTALAIAELGKFDASANLWVTSQPFQIGVLLSSSNASTWTAHQDRDMSFRLLRAHFTQTAKTVPLGTVAVENATDLMLFAPTERPGAATTASYEITLPDGSVIRVDSGQPIQLAAAVTGDIAVVAHLAGSTAAAPVIYPGSQLIVGQVEAAGDYISRAIPAGDNSRARVIFDAQIPGGASVEVAAAGIDESDDWQDLSFVSSQPLDGGWGELVYERTGLSETMLRVKLSLSGSTAARPRVRNLRVIIT
ncbi:hypothetical protein AGMMS50256_11580 [Betaproteobacteria bacterium]|nr:hypothetical protein AGMMS50256_11580 [Betaproteobacteria bacterium]